MAYKKSYKGFAIWLVLYLAISAALFLLPVRDAATLTRLVLNTTAWAIAALAYQIYAGESVYWYNGVTFEDARDAGPERRKAYARRHLQRFAGFAAAFSIFSGAAQAAQVSIWADIAVLTAGLIGVAISTIRIKL